MIIVFKSKVECLFASWTILFIIYKSMQLQEKSKMVNGDWIDNAISGVFVVKEGVGVYRYKN